MCAKRYCHGISVVRCAIGILAIFVAFFLTSCSDIGDRDNPTDPVAKNYSPAQGGSDEPADDCDGDVCDPGGDGYDGSSSSGKESGGNSSAKDSDLTPSVDNSDFCKTASNDECEYGMLVDDRDGHEYRTVKIGDQIWMAQNLNYYYLSEIGESSCYDYQADNCEKYGSLYTWYIAVDNVCPEGWHLPERAEYEALVANAGGKAIAGVNLRSTGDWKKGPKGTDGYGFSALPAGMWDGIDESFTDLGTYAYFWMATEYTATLANRFSIRGVDENSVIANYLNKSHAYSVRCVKNSDEGKVPKSSSSQPRSSSSSFIQSSSSSDPNGSVRCSKDDLWCTDMYFHVETGFGGDYAGYWWASNDNADGGKSYISWPVELGGDYTGMFKPVIGYCKGLCGEVNLRKGKLDWNPYVVVGFNLTGDYGEETPVNVYDWDGICVSYKSDMAFTIELGMGTSVNESFGWGLPLVNLPKAGGVEPYQKCVSWSDFVQPVWVGSNTISGEAASKQLVSIEFHFQGSDGTMGSFNIARIWKYAK